MSAPFLGVALCMGALSLSSSALAETDDPANKAVDGVPANDGPVDAPPMDAPPAEDG